MAIIQITEQLGREAGLTSTRLATYKRVFRVISDTKREGPISIRIGFNAATGIGLYSAYNNGLAPPPPNAGGFPSFGATETDATSYVQNIGCACVAEYAGGGAVWEVVVDYGPYDPAQNPESPFDVPPEVSWEDATWEEIVDQDVHGHWIMNTAGDPFDPPVTRDASRPILRITRNEPLYSPANAYTWRNRTNSDTFAGAPANVAKMRPIKASRLYHPTGVYFWQVNYEIEFNAEAWVKTILNQGLRESSSTTTGGTTTYTRTPVRIGGELATAPVPLDASGKMLAPDGTPHYLTFDIYESVPFGPLNLDPGGALASGSPSNFPAVDATGFMKNGAPAAGIPAAPAEDGGTEG